MRLRYPIYFVCLLGSGLAATLQGCAFVRALEGAGGYYDDVEDARAELLGGTRSSSNHRPYDDYYSADDQDRAEALWRIREARRRRDLVLGMGTADVEAIWGSPRTVETAGDSGSGNERWVYSNSLFGQNGLSPQRTVFFENGRVVGWSTDGR